MPRQDYKIITYDAEENRFFISEVDADYAHEALMMGTWEKPVGEPKDLPVKLVLNRDGFPMDVEYVEDAMSRDEEYRLCRWQNADIIREWMGEKD